MPSREVLTSRLMAGLEALDLELPLSATDQLIDYVLLLDHWNKSFNLTAIRDPLEMVVMHLLDSLAVIPYINGMSLMDIGTGAGIPGIPLAICQPLMKVDLVDSNAKKIRFCRQAGYQLKLQNITAHDRRIEKLEFENKPQQIISRALKSLPEIISLLKASDLDDAEILAMKGKNPEDEILQLQNEGWEINSHELQVPFVDAERHLIIIRKP